MLVHTGQNYDYELNEIFFRETIMDLALALQELFKANNEIKIIGTRHGEKLYETLLTREEMARANDLGGYYRIPCDERDLNYGKYYTEGEEQLSQAEDYHSHNTRRLSKNEVKHILLKLPFIQKEMGSSS